MIAPFFAPFILAITISIPLMIIKDGIYKIFDYLENFFKLNYKHKIGISLFIPILILVIIELSSGMYSFGFFFKSPH